jgi:hypothetical protein
VGCVSPLVHRIAAKTFPTVWQTRPKVETGPTLQGTQLTPRGKLGGQKLFCCQTREKKHLIFLHYVKGPENKKRIDFTFRKRTHSNPELFYA